MNKIDFHSHILPHIDDGAKDIETAIKILEESFRQGVDGIVATPHFKGNEEDVLPFVDNRQKILEEVEKRAKELSVEIPKIYYGAEVAVSPGLSEFTNLRSLCIENTDYILLEMPYSYWYDAIFDEIYKIIVKRGLIPVIAHIERYFIKKTNKEQYSKLFVMDIVLQFNAVSFCSFNSRKRVKNIMKDNYELPFVLGSDCHDLGYRKTLYKKACHSIIKSFGEDFFNNMILTAEKILKNLRTDQF